MTRLEVLKREKNEILGMHTLSFELMRRCSDYFNHEIDCIEKYGDENPEYDTPKKYVFKKTCGECMFFADNCKFAEGNDTLSACGKFKGIENE